MKPLAIALLTLSLATVSDAATVALGVGAVSPNEVILKMDGRDAHFVLEGAKPSGDPAAASFLSCLVAGRVVRVQKTTAGKAKVTMLDGSVVAELVNEFLDTATKIDACALGKAAYQPQQVHVIAEPVASNTKKTGKQTPATNWERSVSSAASPATAPVPFRMPAEVKFPERQQVPVPPIPLPPGPTVAAPETIGIYKPGQAGVQPIPVTSTTAVGSGTLATPGTSTTTTPPTAQPDNPPVTSQRPPG